MLAFHDPRHGLNRRAFLQVGGLALGGLTLPQMLQAAETRRTHTDRSVIFLFLHGGPSQIETFDPKMTAPVEIRSATGEVQTRIPGVTFGGSFPRLAALADRLSVVRSYVTGDGNHDIKPIVGKDTFGANLGSVYARVVGMNRPGSGMPTNIALFPRAVESTSGPAQMKFGNFTASGPFGSNFAPFDPSGGGQLYQNMKLNLPMERLNDRQALLRQLDQIRREVGEGETFESMDRIQQQAFSTIVGGVSEAFDLGKEDPATVARYDTAPLVRPENIDKKWKNYKHYVDNAKTLGKLLLLARRLCERGAGFVTVTTNFVWDMHADQNNATMEEGMRYMGGPLDHALSAFIEDTHARGLQDKILLVATGEMGRTPKINKKGGRDHWGNLAPLLLAGGGLNMGRVLGQSAKDAGTPASEPVRMRNLIGTILHTVLEMGEVRLQSGLPREITSTMMGYEPIAGLHG